MSHGVNKKIPPKCLNPSPSIWQIWEPLTLSQHRSSLIYNTSTRHERHECHTRATLATLVWHSWANTIQHKCYINDVSATWVKNFDFDNDASKNIFSPPYIYCMASERLQGEEIFHSKKKLLEMPGSHAKMRLKSAPLKLNFLMAKAISKSYTRDCSCKCPCMFLNSYA